MSPAYLLDTNVVSEAARPVPSPAVMARLAKASGALALPSVVWHELVFGVSRLPAGRRRTYLERYLEQVVAATMEVLPYDRAAAQWHASERARLTALGRTPSFADGQIAATAATRSLVLVTRNVADFAPFEGLTVEDWFGAP